MLRGERGRERGEDAGEAEWVLRLSWERGGRGGKTLVKGLAPGKE